MNKNRVKRTPEAFRKPPAEKPPERAEEAIPKVDSAASKKITCPWCGGDSTVQSTRGGQAREDLRYPNRTIEGSYYIHRYRKCKECSRNFSSKEVVIPS